MQELTLEEFNIARPLLERSLKYNLVFPYSVTEQIQRGRIFVDDKIYPTACLITSLGGRYLLAGDVTNNDFNRKAAIFLSDKQNHANYYDLYASDESWIDYFKGVVQAQTVSLSRSTFNFNNSKFQQLKNWRNELPKGFILTLMNQELYEKFQNEIDPSYRLFWESPDSFLENGFGFCILFEDQIACVCNSLTVSGKSAEIDIVTVEQYRRKGLATITCAAFMEKCLEHNIEPNWNCDAGNQASKQFTVKLGFEKLDDFPMLWWHEDKEVVASYMKKYSYYPN
jgi:RimJ/RimL family protein N-acetyltransferase